MPIKATLLQRKGTVAKTSKLYKLKELLYHDSDPATVLLWSHCGGIFLEPAKRGEQLLCKTKWYLKCRPTTKSTQGQHSIDSGEVGESYQGLSM